MIFGSTIGDFTSSIPSQEVDRKRKGKVFQIGDNRGEAWSDPFTNEHGQGILKNGIHRQMRLYIEEIFYADGRAQLAAPVNVSKNPEIFSWLPKIVMTSGDPPEIDVLWQEIIFSGGSHGSDILFARSIDGGRSFSEPLNLSHDIASSGKGRLTPNDWHNGSLDLAKGPEGNLYAAWTEYEGTLWFSRSTDRGATFSHRVMVAGRGGKHRARGAIESSIEAFRERELPCPGHRRQ